MIFFERKPIEIKTGFIPREDFKHRQIPGKVNYIDFPDEMVERYKKLYGFDRYDEFTTIKYDFPRRNLAVVFFLNAHGGMLYTHAYKWLRGDVQDIYPTKARGKKIIRWSNIIYSTLMTKNKQHIWYVPFPKVDFSRNKLYPVSLDKETKQKIYDMILAEGYTMEQAKPIIK